MTIVCDITGMTMTVTDEVSGDLPVAEPVVADDGVEAEGLFGHSPEAPPDPAPQAIPPGLILLLQPLITAAVAALTKALTDWLSRIGQPAK